MAIGRKITQGTRGERGRRWCERVWTLLATCVQQGRSAYRDDGSTDRRRSHLGFRLAAVLVEEQARLPEEAKLTKQKRPKRTIQRLRFV